MQDSWTYFRLPSHLHGEIIFSSYFDVPSSKQIRQLCTSILSLNPSIVPPSSDLMKVLVGQLVSRSFFIC